MERKKAVFLDRDGVINHDPGDYTLNLSEFHVLPTAFEAMKSMWDAGYLLVIITNQACIAKGKTTVEAVEEIHSFLGEEARKMGFEIAECYYCPHHPDFSQCLCRKPGSIMVEKALGRFDLDAERCVMIGDKDRDVQCAEGAGVRGVKMDVNGDLLSVWNSIYPTLAV
jgi:D-glycero-D-manno-heptose 1,7-bisphosphate phosphatase